jgi:hypothetical protein
MLTSAKYFAVCSLEMLTRSLWFKVAQEPSIPDIRSNSFDHKCIIELPAAALECSKVQIGAVGLMV